MEIIHLCYCEMFSHCLEITHNIDVNLFLIAEKSKITHQSIAFPIVRCSFQRVASLDCRSSVKLRKILMKIAI